MRSPCGWVVGYSIGVLALAGCLGPIKQNADVQFSTSDRRLEPRAEAEVKQDGQKTLAYWNAINTITAKERKFSSDTSPDVYAAITSASESIAKEIEGLPVLGVDLDVIDFARQFAEMIRSTGVGIASLRWYHGFGWPLPSELKTLPSRAKSLQEEMKELRITLTRRYQLDFPILDLPPG